MQPALTAPSASLPLLSEAAASSLYSHTLQTATAVSRSSVSAGSRQKRDSIMLELSQFLSRLPGTPPPSLHTCSPLDVVVFLQGHYCLLHAGSITPGQLHVMAPGSLKNAVSALSQGFQELARCGPWNPATNHGNPVDSFPVSQWRRGYCNLASQAGYVSRGALELTENKVGAMLLRLQDLISTTSHALTASLHARDGFAISLLWSTGSRGINACQARCAEFQLPSSDSTASQAALPYIYPEFQLTEGQAVEYIPSFLKTVSGPNSESMELLVQPEPFMDPLRWLHLVMQTAAHCQWPITDHLVRPMNPSHSGYQPSSLTTKSMQARVVQLLESMHMYAGETMHSFRRGRAQDMHRTGHSLDAICHRLLNKSKAVVQRHYLPAGRYSTGVKRQRVLSASQATPCMHGGHALASPPAVSMPGAP